MAISDPYANVVRYKTQVSNTAAGDDDSILLSQLKAVSRHIEKRLSPYFFNKDAAATTRIYGPDDRIVPIASLTDLVVKATSGRPITWPDVDPLTIDDDFELWPLNALLEPEPQPYTEIRLLGWSTPSPTVWEPKTYMASDYRMQVTAIHGWPAVTEGIVNATVELAAMLRGESPFSTQVYQNLDQVEQQSPQARALLKALYMDYHPTGIVVA